MQNEGPIRLSIFLGILVIMALWELAAPRRYLRMSKWRRWGSNLGLVVVNTLVMRLVFPILAVGAAIWARENGWGLFNMFSLPEWLEVAAAVILLDMAIYWQHRLFHMIPLFWRMHRMHHADRDFDVTTALRFHPLEIVVSMVIKLALVVVLGPAALAVLIFEVLLNGTAMFNHANVVLPAGLDRRLRLVLVTPDMHRVHHSVASKEFNRNFGFNLPWWDHLFGSYKAQPEQGHDAMEIGLRAYDPSVCANLLWMLVLPFKAIEDEQNDQG